MAYTTIDNPELYFQTKLYTGTGSSHAITLDGSENMQPDWVWIKSRTDSAHHALFDAVRGATKALYSNQTDSETTVSGHLTAFGSDGFTLGDNSGKGNTNENNKNYVAWNWLANGTGSSNSDGTITSSVSANTTAGFSIVKFTASGSGNQTTGHGLGATPQVVIVKHLSDTGNWQVYFEGIGTANQQYLKLNATSAVTNISGLWGAGMTSSLIGIGINVAVTAGEDCIAYCFAEKKGYSKFGSYTGNGNADGPFVYTGFRPAWVLQKNVDATQGWQLQDNKRLGYNPDNYLLQPHTNQAESALQRVDLLSNGFKVRTTDAGQNSSGTTYIYIAFAESPFVNSNGVPNNAR